MVIFRRFKKKKHLLLKIIQTVYLHMQLPNFAQLDVNCLYTNKEWGDFFAYKILALPLG